MRASSSRVAPGCRRKGPRDGQICRSGCLGCPSSLGYLGANPCESALQVGFFIGAHRSLAAQPVGQTTGRAVRTGTGGRVREIPGNRAAKPAPCARKAGGCQAPWRMAEGVPGLGWVRPPQENMQTLEPKSKDLNIKYPDVDSEFEVHAMLYFNLRQAGWDARGEVPFHGSFGLRKAKAACRFDLVIFNQDKTPRFIIEVKARPVRHKTTVEDTRQGTRYPMFGVPVHFVYGMQDAAVLLNKLGAATCS